MKRVLLATGNKFKLAQMQYVSDYYKMKIRVIPARDIFGALSKFDKMGRSPEEVALRGAQIIFGKIKRPIVTEETFLEVESLKKFPGIKTIPFVKTKGRKALLAMMAGEDNRRAIMKSATVFINEKGEEQVFSFELPGTIAEEERWAKGPLWVSPQEKDWGGWFNAIFIPEGSKKTLAEMTAEQLIQYGYREQTFKKALEIINQEPEPEI
ncbi:MAG: non-canonical purine NTP pyrophosphatase [Candidatus Nanoarchaeia archaeon]|jgi:XTP/dITP diphosphohydrolase